MGSLKKVMAAVILVGVLLFLLKVMLPELDLSMDFTIFGVIAFLLFTTFALKLFTSAETFYIISMLRTQRFIGFIEKISRPRLWDVLADIGLVIGFGTIAVDYLVGRKKSRAKRAIIDAVSIVSLFFLFSSVFGFFFLSNDPDVALLLLALTASFALGGLMLFALVALVWQMLDIFSKLMVGKTPCPGVAPIIPGVQIPNVPATFTPPLYIWITFVIILVVHEFSHGALIRRAQSKIKSVGLLLAGIFPIGAFVEPDEKELREKPTRQQLRVFAIGPAANLYAMPIIMLFLLLFGFAMAAFVLPYTEAVEKEAAIGSVVVSEVMDDYELCGNPVNSSAKGEIEEGWLLLEYNGIDLNSLYNFKQAFAGADRNVSLLLQKPDGTTVEKTIEKNQYGKIGIRMEIGYAEGYQTPAEYNTLMFALSILLNFFGWLLLLSFAVAVVNFLPIDPFDGGRIAKIMLLPYFGWLKMSEKDTERFIGRLFLWIVGILLLLNALPLFL